MKTNAHGVYSTIETEKDFLEITTKTPFVVVHFGLDNFPRCQIVDKHLQVHFSPSYQSIIKITKIIYLLIFVGHCFQSFQNKILQN